VLGVDPILVLLEVAPHYRRAARLEMPRALAVARKDLAVVVDDAQLDPEHRASGARDIAHLLLVAHLVPIGRRRPDSADRGHLGHAPQVADANAALAEPADRRRRRGRSADDDRVELAELGA